MSLHKIALSMALMVLLLPIGSCAGYPVLHYYVTDMAGALYEFEELDIEELCIIVYEKTGAEIAVLVVNTTQPDDIDTFAAMTFQENGIGQEGVDNGLLLLVSTDDQLWRVEVGYGLEGILPDALVGSMAETYLLPAMADGDYYGGIYDMVNHLGGEILENYNGAPQKSRYPLSWIPLSLWQLILVVVVVVALTAVTRGRIVFFPLYLIGRRGGKNWGGGRSGGGGAGGRW